MNAMPSIAWIIRPSRPHITYTTLAPFWPTRGLSPTPGWVNYSIPNQPATVHDLLLQKSDGTFELVLWGERFCGRLRHGLGEPGLKVSRGQNV